MTDKLSKCAAYAFSGVLPFDSVLCFKKIAYLLVV